MKNLVLLAGIAFLSVLTMRSSPSAQAGSPASPPDVLPPNRQDCFQEYLGNLIQCRDAFCPNRLTDCNQTALEECLDGARIVLNSCLGR